MGADGQQEGSSGMSLQRFVPAYEGNEHRKSGTSNDGR